MPVMDGCRATAAIRSLEAATGRRSVPIIACTTEDVSPGSPTLRACMDAGMNAASGKPMTLTQAAQMLRQHVAGWTDAQAPAAKPRSHPHPAFELAASPPMRAAR